MKKCGKRGILYRHWDAPAARAAAILVHGLGGHSNNWDFVGSFLRGHGISSYAIELKGFGKTEGLRGHIDSLDVYIRDVRRLRSIVHRAHRKLPIFIAGESMGGLISFLTVIKKPSLFRGLICMSPGFASALSFSFAEYVKMVSARLYNSKKQFIMPFTNDMCTQDPHCKQIMDQDTLEHKFATPKLLQSILLGQLSSILNKHRIARDTLFLLSGDDTFVSTPFSRKIFKGIKHRNKELIEYPGMRHSLTMELGREKVFADMLAWMDKRI